jgi:hypothetical protein
MFNSCSGGYGFRARAFARPGMTKEGSGSMLRIAPE